MPEFPIHNSPHFDVREWVDPRTWQMLNVRAAWLIDPVTVHVANVLREIAGAPVVINNWHYETRRGNQVYKSSGFRSVWDKTGALLSQHRRGTAFDAKVTGFSPSLIFELIRRNKAAFLNAGLTTLENIAFTPTWVHFDTRPRIAGIHPENDFLIVDPA